MIRRATTLFLLIACVLTVVLYNMENQVEGFQTEIRNLNRQIVEDRKAIHVLKAEWSYLNDPERLKKLAEHHLDLKPVEPGQIGSLADLPEKDAEVEAAYQGPVSEASSPGAVVGKGGGYD